MRPAPILLAMSLVASQAEAQQPILLSPGQTVVGGANVVSPSTGIGLVVPEGFQGAWDADVGALVLNGQGGTVGGVWGWSEGSVEEVAQEVGSRLEAQGLQLQPREPVEMDQDGMRGVFVALSSEGSSLLHAAIRRGAAGNVIAVAALGAAGAEGASLAFVDSLLKSLTWSPPGAAGWAAEAAGTVFEWRGGGSDMSSGTTTATGASQSTATLALCGMRQYRYAEQSETYVSIEGMSASSNSSDGHAGEWFLVADLAGGATLLLESSDGRSFRWPVRESGDGVLIDGYAYRVSGSC